METEEARADLGEQAGRKDPQGDRSRGARGPCPHRELCTAGVEPTDPLPVPALILKVAMQPPRLTFLICEMGP